MNNFRIEIKNNEYKVFFEQKYIGRIEHSQNDSGYYVMPDGATYSGYFKELDTAITELVFHSYAQNKQVPQC